MLHSPQPADLHRPSVLRTPERASHEQLTVSLNRIASFWYTRKYRYACIVTMPDRLHIACACHSIGLGVARTDERGRAGAKHVRKASDGALARGTGGAHKMQMNPPMSIAPRVARSWGVSSASRSLNGLRSSGGNIAARAERGRKEGDGRGGEESKGRKKGAGAHARAAHSTFTWRQGTVRPDQRGPP